MKSKTVISAEGANNLTIVTDNRKRELKCLADLGKVEHEQFDYVKGDQVFNPRFFRFHGEWYDVYEFERCNGKAFSEWHGNQPDSFSCGVLIKYVPDSESNTVIVGGYYC